MTTVYGVGMTKLITDPELLRLTVDLPKPNIVIAEEVPPFDASKGFTSKEATLKTEVTAVKLPPFLETQKLRDAHKAAVMYWHGTGDRTLMDALGKAVDFAESVEDPSTASRCLVCGDRVPLSHPYCGYDCAETDGAIEK